MNRVKRETKEKVDILIVNASELVTLAGSSEKPRVGEDMQELSSIHDGGVAIRDGRIIAVGKTTEISKHYKGETVISCNSKTVLPGFVDAHTHLVFAGSREDEFQMRIEGAPYMEILSAGGGILSTVRDTRRASLDRLVNLGIERLDAMLQYGVTTVEAKSGYGLSTEDELKILNVMKRLDQLHSVDVVPTFMGAHAVPQELKGNVPRYVEMIIEEMIPRIADRGLAEFCDVFCERGAFSLEQSKKILSAAKNHLLGLKIHADEMSRLGGAELAADANAISAEHLLFASDQGLKAMAHKNVIAVLLPAAAFSLLNGRFADARKMIDYNVPIALGSDFNPSCWVENMQLVIGFACHFMHLMPAEAIIAATINAAHAVNRAKEIGSLEPGKQADILVLDAPNHTNLGYRFGSNLVDKVIKNGRVVIDHEDDGDRLMFLDKTD